MSRRRQIWVQHHKDQLESQLLCYTTPRDIIHLDGKLDHSHWAVQGTGALQLQSPDWSCPTCHRLEHEQGPYHGISKITGKVTIS